MKRGSDGANAPSTSDDNGVAPLCASCDRCRSRKTRCDGKKPCTNCANKYMKKHKVTSVEGIEQSEFDCVYSPAKRRGPVPGRVGAKKSGDAKNKAVDVSMMDQATVTMLQQQALVSSQLDPSLLQQQGLGAAGAFADAGMMAGGAGMMDQAAQMQQLMALQQLGGPVAGMPDVDLTVDQGPSRRFKAEAMGIEVSAPDTIAAHAPLLGKDSIEGNRLRSYYCLSVDELYSLPPIPSDADYCAENNIPVNLIPKKDEYALNASRFAEIAIGALVHNEVSLAMELSNATVQCLRECSKEPLEGKYGFEIARSYFLLGAFRACRGDMVRYFKYRRVCMSHVAKLDNPPGYEFLLAAMAYLDSWAYMMYNASEKNLPNIDESFPQVVASNAAAKLESDLTRQYNVGSGASGIAQDPQNQMWIQGAPPVYLNNEAPLPARSLDALACAIRSCCDQANSRFATIAQEADPVTSSTGALMPPDVLSSSTTTAVMAHEDELCSRNMVVSAYTLLQQHESSTGKTTQQNQGHHMVISALDAFLDGGDEDGSGGFTDAQVQSLLSVCNTAIENPLLLHHGGPTYHMVSNAAILLCHLLNGMHALNASSATGRSREMEAAVFEEVLDTFLSVRKLLNIHRRKLPVNLRCHGIPRPSMEGPTEGQPYVDLGETLMCGCRGCQGFVLMACSPCVAAERARSATLKREIEEVREMDGLDEGGLDRALYELENEFDLDDDALLNMLSSITTEN